VKAVDTNILVRLIVRDESVQVAIAREVLASGDILILPTVLLECEWVLRSIYALSRKRIALSMKALCGLNNVHVVSADTIAAVLARYAETGDFADLMHVALAQELHVAAFVTFDRDLSIADVSELPIELV